MPIAIGQITITDQNDFWTGAEAPDPTEYKLWFDTTINKWKKWNGAAWDIVSDYDAQLEETNNRIVGVNLCPNSLINENISATGVVTRSVQLLAGKTYCLSVTGNTASSFDARLKTRILYNGESLLTNVLTSVNTTTSTGVFTAENSGEHTIESRYYSPTDNTDGSVFLDRYKLELGDRPTKWIEAPEDTAARIAELDYLKPALAGSTDIAGGVVATNLLMLKSSANGSYVGGMSGLYNDPIAIWTGGTHQNAVDLLAKFIVLKDGSIYGAGGKFKALADGTLVQEFRHTSNGVTRIITISSETGEISTQVIGDDNSIAKMSSDGIIANGCDVQAVPTSTGIRAKASIAGLGYGNLAKDLLGSDFMCGVYGTANNINQNPAPSYGGYFNKLRANGLTLGTKIIYNSTISTNINVYLSSVVTMVISTTTAYNDPTVWLPTDAYVGHVVFVRQWGGGRVNVGCNPGKIYDDSSSEYSYPVDNGQMAMFTYIGEFGGYPTWLINRMSF